MHVVRIGLRHYRVFFPGEEIPEDVRAKIVDRSPAVKTGDFVWTDDGYLVEVVGKAWGIVETTGGYLDTDPGRVFLYEPHGKIVERRWSWREVKLFARYYVKTIGRPDWPIYPFDLAFPRLRHWPREYKIDYITRLVSRKKVVERLMSELSEELERAGMTREWWLSQVKQLAETSDGKVKLEVLRFLGPYLGIRPEETRSNKVFFLSPRQIKALEEAKIVSDNGNE